MKYLLFSAIKSQEKKARGFTLIELLIVLILLGVLAAISLPSLLGQIAKGRQAEARAALGLINRAQIALGTKKRTLSLKGFGPQEAREITPPKRIKPATKAFQPR